MSESQDSTHETLSGEGQVLQSNIIIATVIYNITVSRELVQAAERPMPGLKNVAGSISLIDGERFMMITDELTLRVQDGREAVFLVNRGSLDSGTYSIRAKVQAPNPLTPPSPPAAT